MVIWDNLLLRNQWVRGVISKVYPGQDGGVRVADVRTTSGTYKRPERKLCVLVKKCSTSDLTEIQEGECRGRTESNTVSPGDHL